MKFLIFPNVTNPEAVAFAAHLTQVLMGWGQTCFSLDEAEQADADIVLVVGGDGTVLRAVRAFYGQDVPFLCVNCGHLGYLSECERDNAEEVLQQVVAGHYYLEKRAVLTGSVVNGETTTDFYALNEIAIHRGGYSRNLHLSLEIGDQPITDFSGDGLVVSTPTGSTAYNLAAGGPILMPESMCLAVTPICAHTSLCAPLVVDDSAPVTVTLRVYDADEENEQPTLYADSCHRVELSDGAKIHCSIDRHTANFIRISHVSFYHRLRLKMANNLSE